MTYFYMSAPGIGEGLDLESRLLGEAFL